MRSLGVLICCVAVLAAAVFAIQDVHSPDVVGDGGLLFKLQTEAILSKPKKSDVAHWGADPSNYTEWGNHSNRLIPVYTFGTKDAGSGIDLRDYTDGNSPYRSAESLQRIYGYLPEHTVTSDATYLDQTNLFDIQKAALTAGKKHIFLVVFDGMDWDTTRAAAIFYSRKVSYSSGRGSGLHFQDYTAGGNTQFGYMVTSPHNSGTKFDVDKQTVLNPGGTRRGGYDITRGGPNPWTPTSDMLYLTSRPENDPTAHAFTDSSASATSMTTGAKTYNDALNVDATGAQLTTIAHLAQEAGYSVGAVSSVPFCHATPGASYAHNVQRDDYQDIARDMFGLSSISHPNKPLPGLDVVIGTGWGVDETIDRAQGENFVSGNRAISDADRAAINVNHGGKYVVAQRKTGVKGGSALLNAAQEAASSGHRLFGFYGTKAWHLPFRTANGDYRPPIGRKPAEQYTSDDITENPTLAEMTKAALTVLANDPEGFWLMVESGDVDWANHDNNLDNSIGAVKSGDDAVKVITDWVETHGGWKDSVLIVTADHGHYLHLLKPEGLIPPAKTPARRPATKPPTIKSLPATGDKLDVKQVPAVMQK